MSEEKSKRGDNKKEMGGLSGGIFLIGIGVIFWLNLDFFPWILLVAGLSSLPASLANESLWAGLQGFIWMAGLAVLFATNMFWPGILILAGLSTIAGALAKPDKSSEGKRKRVIEEDVEDAEETFAPADETPFTRKKAS
jgi:hypothetical protein